MSIKATEVYSLRESMSVAWCDNNLALITTFLPNISRQSLTLDNTRSFCNIAKWSNLPFSYFRPNLGSLPCISRQRMKLTSPFFQAKCLCNAKVRLIQRKLSFKSLIPIEVLLFYKKKFLPCKLFLIPS